MHTKKYKGGKSRRRVRKGRKTKQRGGCINGQCMTGGNKHKNMGSTHGTRHLK